jgi:hypothetical protein
MPRDCGSGALQMVNECIRRQKEANWHDNAV